MVLTLVVTLIVTPGLASFARTDATDHTLPTDGLPKTVERLAPGFGTAHVRLLGVNDLHGYLEPPDPVGVSAASRPVGGAACLAAYMERYDRGDDHTVRVHAGDMVSASPLVSAHFHDEPTVLAMNEMGFDVGTLGNHEFDEGGREMRRLVEGGQREDAAGRPADNSDPDYPGAAFPYLAANTLDRETGRTVFPPYTVVERDGVRIGFIGVTTLETPEIIIPSAAAEFRFTDISRTVNRHAATLEARGVEAIVVLAHSGARDTDRGGTADEIVVETKQMRDSVDVIFSGHTHNRLKMKVADKLILQSEEYGTGLGIVDLEVDRATGDVTFAKSKTVTTFDDRVRPDTGVAALVNEHRRRVAPLSERVVGRAGEEILASSAASGESPLGDFVADGQRKLAGTDFAIVPTGGLRTGIPRGPVTYGELFSVQPSGRDLLKTDLTGEQVRRALEAQFRPDRDHRMAVSGLRYAYDPSRPAGDRVTSLTLPDRSPLDPEEDYSVAVNGFLAAGGGDFKVFTEGESSRTVGTDIEALVRQAGETSQPFFAPEPDRRPRVTLEQ